ncbi:hypothetical protein BH09PSE4_BH09PSE4_22880 [soil metagenome]
MSEGAFQARIDEVRAKVDIAAVISAGGVALTRGKNPRGKCPFHGSKSDAFTVYPGSGGSGGFAKCWGCPWSGDAIKFVQDTYGLTFVEALERLEGEHGLDGLTAAPIRTAKVVRERADRELIDSAAMGRFLWKGATHRPEAVRTYLLARGVPAAMLGDDRLGDIRFHALAPIDPWPVDMRGPPSDAPKAPAICALIRQPIVVDGGLVFRPIGVHVTFLSPALDGKMERQRRSGKKIPARKMLGEAKGGVLLGRTTPIAGTRDVSIDANAPLYDGEGIETTLSGMAIAGAAETAIGLAVLSLDNLQGQPRLWKGGIWPLHDIRPDPERSPAIAFPHRGAVPGLIDADMSPLLGPRDPRTGEPLGMKVVERRGGPIVQRAITGAERAAICGELFVKSWRGAGCHRVTAVRPRMGLDFNDAIREASA